MNRLNFMDRYFVQIVIDDPSFVPQIYLIFGMVNENILVLKPFFKVIITSANSNVQSIARLV